MTNSSRDHVDAAQPGDAEQPEAAAGETQSDAGAGADEVQGADPEAAAPVRSDREVWLEAQVSRLEAALRQKEARLDEVFRAYRTADEEFKRVRERLERDQQREVEAEKSKAISMFFEVADNLERSLDAATKSDSRQALLDGLQLVNQQFHDTLVRLGVTQIQAEGTRFDPDQHEAMGVMPVGSPEQHQTVVGVMRTGYRLGDAVLRPALVMVGQHSG